MIKKKFSKVLFYFVKNFVIYWFKWASLISLIFMLCIYLECLQISTRDLPAQTTTINTKQIHAAYNGFKMFLSLSLIYLPIVLAGIQQVLPFVLHRRFKKGSNK
ncbi:unnamed protein product [Fructobacillus fructosus]|uniref:Uncharacterized protein n=1 Tax=Fructobacillus fructosus TaxID=1631 RepID=A0ABN9YKZ1_9LACO|nr:unnamed protein product [Fructobacillus fructosus]